MDIDRWQIGVPQLETATLMITGGHPNMLPPRQESSLMSPFKDRLSAT